MSGAWEEPQRFPCFNFPFSLMRLCCTHALGNPSYCHFCSQQIPSLTHLIATDLLSIYYEPVTVLQKKISILKAVTGRWRIVMHEESVPNNRLTSMILIYQYITEIARKETPEKYTYIYMHVSTDMHVCFQKQGYGKHSG